MIATTVMGVIMLAWSGVDARRPAGRSTSFPPGNPTCTRKVERRLRRRHRLVPLIDPVTGEQQDPLGWLGNFPQLAEPLRNPTNWLSLIGAIGIIIAFGHSILAMSGEETLAQVYREVESPKLPQLQEGRLHRLRLQPAAHRQHEFPGRAADPRRRAA